MDAGVCCLPLVGLGRHVKHGQFSSVQYAGPRTAYAFDFYGVAASSDGYKWILSVIDLFSREVLFRPLRSRTADETLANLLRYLIFTKGVPTVFMTDEAREFVGKLLSVMCTALGIEHITTKGYNPRGNAINETVHRFSGECLTLLEFADRKDWPRRLPEFAFAHNTTMHDGLGFTPFEIGHGTKAVTLTASLGMSDDGKVVNDDDVQGYFGELKQRARKYHEVAKMNLAVAAQDQNKRLNAGSRQPTFAQGDVVSIYCPSRGLDDWKQKHTKQWRGPMRVTQRLSNTTYEMEELSSHQLFRRSVMNINRYRADPEEKGPAVAVQDEDYADGNFRTTQDLLAGGDSGCVLAL